ncbi:MAG: ATP-dependent helicase, partial [Anaeromyxobacteraceae bacterium]
MTKVGAPGESVRAERSGEAAESKRPPSLALTPTGHLALRPAEPGEAPALEPAVARRIEAAFARGEGHGLLHLGAAEARTALPPALAFWRDFGRRFVEALCATPALEEERERAEVPAREADLERHAAAAPPFTGAEYLTPFVLRRLWGELLAAFRAEIARADGTVQAWLAAQDAAWNLVGRVHLHLA